MVIMISITVVLSLSKSTPYFFSSLWLTIVHRFHYGDLWPRKVSLHKPGLFNGGRNRGQGRARNNRCTYVGNHHTLYLVNGYHKSKRCLSVDVLHVGDIEKTSHHEKSLLKNVCFFLHWSSSSVFFGLSNTNKTTCMSILLPCRIRSFFPSHFSFFRCERTLLSSLRFFSCY